MRALALAAALAAAAPALAGYEVDGVALGMSEAQVRSRFPSAHCKPLEWQSDAAERRCDDGRIRFAGVHARVTFYLKADAVEGIHLRFDAGALEAVRAHLKAAYGPPREEGREPVKRGEQTLREIFRAVWRDGEAHALLRTHGERRRAELNFWRGEFEARLYRVR